MTWNVVHGQVVQVSLDELESLIFDHLDALAGHLVGVLHQLFAVQSKSLLAVLERLVQDSLHILKSLNTVPHAEAEVTEPFVVECNSPVLGQELDNIGNDLGFLTRPQLIEVILVETNEGPERLEDDLLVAHIGNGINQADGVEGELDVVALAGADVQVVAHQVGTVLVVRFVSLRREDQGVRCLDVVVNQVVGKHTTLALREVELRNFLGELFEVVLVGLRIIDVKYRASQTGTHLTTVVTVHAQTAAHSLRKELVGELAKRSSSEDAAISGGKVLVNNESAVVNKAVVVN